MGYSIHIQREPSITIGEWKEASEKIEGVKHDPSDIEALNPVTGEKIFIPETEGSVSVFFPEENEWYPVFSYSPHGIVFQASRDWDDNFLSPVRKAASLLALELNAELVGDEGETYSKNWFFSDLCGSMNKEAAF